MNLFTNHMKILFWIRKKQINARGECAIYCRITINKQRGNDFSTGIFTPITGGFNAKTQQFENNEIANIHLNNLKHKIHTIYLDLENKGIFITPSLIGEYIKGKKTINKTLVNLMSEYLEFRKKQIAIGEIKDASYINSVKTVKNINLFLASTQQRQIEVQQISPKIAQQFYYWLQTNKNTGAEYAAKSVQIVKAIINYAVINDYIQASPLNAIRFKRGERKKIEFLQPMEVELLQLHKFASQRLQQVADLFLLQCYTGFSYADLAEFNPKTHIETDNTEKQWIIKPRFKNGIESVLPYSAKAKKIIDKYTSIDILNEKTLKLPNITNQKYNAYLKEVGEILGFSVKLTTHIGRKTFGTIALNDGYSIESVSKMLGHTNIKTTQGHYAVVLRKRIVGEG